MNQSTVRGPITFKPGERDLRTFQLSKARKRLEKLRTSLKPTLTDNADRKLIQLCIILENILDGLEG